MRSERSPALRNALAHWLVLVTFPRPETAERRIAGLSVAGRIAAEAYAAGARQIWLVADEAPALSAESAADIGRVCPEAEVNLLSRSEAEARLEARAKSPVIFLGGRHLLRAPVLRRLVETGAMSLHSGRETVAACRRSGAKLVSLDDVPIAGPSDPEVIPLDDESAATFAIVRTTAKRSDGFVSRRINRPVSQIVSKTLLLATPGIRPWHMTLFTAALSLPMFLLLGWGGARGLVFGGLLFQASSILDGVDGELARATFRSSTAGAMLDTAVDMAGNLLFMLGLTIGLSRVKGAEYAMIGGWGFFALIAGLIILWAVVRRINEPGNFDVLKRHYRQRYPSGPIRKVTEALILLISRDMFAFVLALLCLVGAAGIGLCLFTFATTVWLVLILVTSPTLLRGGDLSAVPSRMTT